jgi:hypothetical protein
MESNDPDDNPYEPPKCEAESRQRSRDSWRYVRYSTLLVTLGIVLLLLLSFIALTFP